MLVSELDEINDPLIFTSLIALEDQFDEIENTLYNKEKEFGEKLKDLASRNHKEVISAISSSYSDLLGELDKTTGRWKSIIVTFSEDQEVFKLEVYDAAHEFPLEILSKLGERGNSTNGTGNGYPEIFEFLAETKASFIIEEKLAGDRKPTKTIHVIFDNQSRIAIKSEYRSDELKTALKDTEIQVIESGALSHYAKNGEIEQEDGVCKRGVLQKHGAD